MSRSFDKASSHNEYWVAWDSGLQSYSVTLNEVPVGSCAYKGGAVAVAMRYALEDEMIGRTAAVYTRGFDGSRNLEWFGNQSTIKPRSPPRG